MKFEYIAKDEESLRILIFGGSLGALEINGIVKELVLLNFDFNISFGNSGLPTNGPVSYGANNIYSQPFLSNTVINR